MNRGIIEHKKGMAVAAMTAFLVILFFTLICVGRYPISPLRAFEIMGRSLLGNTEGLDAYESSVILSIRLPRILMGLLVGAGLSVSGVVYQAVFGNPLVSPDIHQEPVLARHWRFCFRQVWRQHRVSLFYSDFCLWQRS